MQTRHGDTYGLNPTLLKDFGAYVGWDYSVLKIDINKLHKS
jgi:hypothetical protein